MPAERALFGVAGLMVYAEKAVPAHQNSSFSDPVVDAAALTSVGFALAWQWFGWTEC